MARQCVGGKVVERQNFSLQNGREKIENRENEEMDGAMEQGTRFVMELAGRDAMRWLACGEDTYG